MADTGVQRTARSIDQGSSPRVFGSLYAEPRRRGDVRDSGVRSLYAGSGVGLLVTAGVVGWVAVGTGWGQLRDQNAMAWVARLSVSGNSMAQTFAAWTVPMVATVFLIAMALASARLNMWVVLRSLLVVAVPLVAAVVIKQVVPRPRLTDVWALTNSFPSGTVTAVAGVVTAIVLATPRGIRVLVVLPSLVAVIATVYMVLALQWHRPSDVIGGLLLVGGVTLVLLARGDRKTAARVISTGPPVDPVIADGTCERLSDRYASGVSVHDEGASGTWR